MDGLKQALVEDAQARIDQAVEGGDLTEAQADELREGLEERIDHFVDHAMLRFHGAGPGLRIPDDRPFW